MIDLWHSLQKSEFSYLKIVAEKWGLPFSAPDARRGVDQISHHLTQTGVLAQIDEVLTREEQEVLVWLDDQGGKAPWSQITRRFGELREMGAGRLDRERPDRAPVSPLEGLWYRALIARGFFETEDGPLEYAYLPEDLREMIMPLLNPGRTSRTEGEFICRVAAQREKAVILPGHGFVLDQLCTLLAGARSNLDPSVHLPGLTDPEEGFYQALASAAGLLMNGGDPAPEQVRDFFELPEGDALKILWDSWLALEIPPELNLLPEIEVEGDPPLDPIRIRKQVLSYLGGLVGEEWWSIESLIWQIRERDPDFLRVGGEYESWFIKRKIDQEYLKGFKHWDEVEGALLRFFITGPIFWLGFAVLGAPEEDSSPRAFQLTPLFADFLAGRSPSHPAREADLVQIRSQGEIRMSVDVPRKARYQIARFCDWHPLKADAYQYRLSPGSLARAEGQGLRVQHLLSLLKNHTEAIPPNLLAALERWEKHGSQASIQPGTVLRLGSPAILKALKESRASRYILEQLGPTALLIHPGSEEKVSQVLMELGFFVKLEDHSGFQA